MTRSAVMFRALLLASLMPSESCDRHESAPAARSSALAEEARADAEPLIGDLAVQQAVFERVPIAQDDDDLDSDGFDAPDDPDDSNPFVFPGAVDEPCNGLDEDGDGVELCPEDRDGDGVPVGRDCDDADPGVSPRTFDLACDGVDQNCNGFDECDRDRDGTDDEFDLDPLDPLVGAERQEEEVEEGAAL